MFEAIIQAAWFDYTLINIAECKELLAEINLNENTSQLDNDAHQGVLEIFAAIECLVEGIATQEVKYFANIAENVINWKDILDNFSDNSTEPGESQVSHEHKIQLQFIKALSENKMANTLAQLSQYRTA